MALEQVAYRARNDSHALNDPGFTHGADSEWTQVAGVPLRVRLAVAGTGSVGGQLQFSTGGTVFTSVTDTSGTVQATRSACFADDAGTCALLTESDGFVSGSGDEEDGAVDAVTLAAEHTELEYCIQLVASDVTAGGTILLRVAGLDTYTRTPRLTVQLGARDRVRLAIGDTDSSDPLLFDDEVDSYIASWPENLTLAAAEAAEAIAGKFSRGFNFTTDGQTFNRRERVLHYMTLAETLRKRGGTFEWPRT